MHVIPVELDRAIRNGWRSFRRRRYGARNYNVLGICSTGHGASLALVSSVHGIRALSLDRYLRKKYAVLLAKAEYEEIRAHETEFARTSRFLLSDCFGRFPPTMVLEDGWQAFLDTLLRGTALTASDIDLVVSSECHFAVNRFQLGRKLSSYFPNAVVITNIEHHAIHRFQAFFASPFDESAVLTIDNCGEPLRRLGGASLSITLSTAAGNSFKVLAEHQFPECSPGLLYHRFTTYLGFRAGEEGKTMGLSSYGTEACYRALAPHLRLNEDGSFYFLNRTDLRAALRDFGAKPRLPGTAILPVHGDVAKAGQMLLNDVVANAVTALGRVTSSQNLCVAGGVALNSVSNEYAFRRSRFRNLYIMPNAGDSGQALGCALYGAHVRRGDRSCRRILNDSLGPAYSEQDVASALQRANLQPESPLDLFATVAEMLASGFIVGWFQGGSEYGPRALGSRSILADGRPVGVKDYLNHHVKHRESFRPYAPAVLEERASEWFDLEGSSPFMLRVVEVRPEKRSILAGVTHIDGTARVQTVNRRQNAPLYDLIRAFELQTGVPVILNTSFNTSGDPIVETPEDAIKCFLRTRIDVLVMSRFLVRKIESNPVSEVLEADVLSAN